MGCWNKTCGITQLPIFAGDPVVYFMIYENGNEGLNFLTDVSLYWSIIPIPFYGEYNDYGACKDYDGQDHKYKFVEDTIKEFLIDNRKDWHKTESIYDNPFVNGYSYFECVNRDTWRLKNGRKFQIFMVHADIYKSLTDVYVDYSKRNVKLEQMVSICNETINLAKTIELDIPEKLLHKLCYRYMHYRTALENIVSQKAIELNIERSKLFYSAQYSIVDIIFDPVRTFITGEFKHKFLFADMILNSIVSVEDSLRLACFFRAMTNLRKQIIPMIGEGSQETLSFYHKIMTKFMDKKITENILEVEGEDSLIKPDSGRHALELFLENKLYYKQDNRWWMRADTFDFGQTPFDQIHEFESIIDNLGYVP